MPPVAFHDVTFHERFDFARFVVEVLARKRNTGVDPWNDREPLDALGRARDVVAGTDLAPLLRAAVCSAMSKPELDVRAQALAFVLADATALPHERAAAISVAREEALAGRGMKLVRRLVADDVHWAETNAEGLVRADPLVFPALLLALKKHGGDVLGVIEALAPLGLVPEASFVEAIESHVLDPESWRRIRRRMPNTGTKRASPRDLGLEDE